MPSSVRPQATTGSSSYWLCVDFVVANATADILGAECFDLGSCGLQSEDVEGTHTRLTVFFDQEAKPDVIQKALDAALQRLGSERIEFHMSQEAAADWNSEWRRFYKPVWATESIVVHPPWILVDIEPGQMAIVIDPAMAFGTGGHESTQTALAGLEDTRLDGRRLLDIGTGSGVLTIAACHLGAANLVAVDTDPVAIENARLNVRTNLGAEKMAQHIVLREGSVSDAGDGPFDVIVANIESHILLPMVPAILQRLAEGGCIIFSGLLRREERLFIDGLISAGLAIDGRWQRDDWFSCRAYRAV